MCDWEGGSCAADMSSKCCVVYWHREAMCGAAGMLGFQCMLRRECLAYSACRSRNAMLPVRVAARVARLPVFIVAGIGRFAVHIAAVRYPVFVAAVDA